MITCPGDWLLVIYFPEPIAESGDRKDKLWSLGVFLQFLPQADYVGIDGSGERIGAITPYRPQQLVSRHTDSYALDEITKKLEFTSRKINRLSISSNLRSPDIYT